MLICEYSATCHDLSIFLFFSLFLIDFQWNTIFKPYLIFFFFPYELNMGNMGNPHIKEAWACPMTGYNPELHIEFINKKSTWVCNETSLVPMKS